MHPCIAKGSNYHLQLWRGCAGHNNYVQCQKTQQTNVKPDLQLWPQPFILEKPHTHKKPQHLNLMSVSQNQNKTKLFTDSLLQHPSEGHLSVLMLEINGLQCESSRGELQSVTNIFFIVKHDDI